MEQQVQIGTDISENLLDIADQALHDLFDLSKEPPADRNIDIPYQGAFVTLHNGDELRGCIGYLAKLKPLGDAVYEIAQKSATADRRFAPVSQDELPDLSIEITVLEPMEDIQSPDDLEIGTHGVYIEQGHRRGILLPQVASDRGWSPERFVEAVCEKALLPTGAWRTPGARLKRFSAAVLTKEEHHE